MQGGGVLKREEGRRGFEVLDELYGHSLASFEPTVRYERKQSLRELPRC